MWIAVGLSAGKGGGHSQGPVRLSPTCAAQLPSGPTWLQPELLLPGRLMVVNSLGLRLSENVFFLKTVLVLKDMFIEQRIPH